MRKDQIDTPALIIDLDALESNIASMAAFAKYAGVNVRPHFKHHKVVEIAQLQLKAGAMGFTCAKLGEAEVLARHGFTNLLVANQVVGIQKINRLIEISRQADVTVAVDQFQNAQELSRAAQDAGVRANVLIEVEVGLMRCGMPPKASTLGLAKSIVNLPNIRLRGLMGYEGHVLHIADLPARRAACERSNRLLVETTELLRSNGIQVGIVSAGSTGTFNITGLFPGITEIQAGSYCLMDNSYSKDPVAGGSFKRALSLLTMVTSRPTSDRVVVDAGMKAVAVDQGLPTAVISGIESLDCHEEHSLFRIVDPTIEIHVGDRLELIPGHTCTTINLHDKVYCCHGEMVEAVWEVAARGKFT